MGVTIKAVLTGMAGLAIVLLSFTSWMEFTIIGNLGHIPLFTVNGRDFEGITGFGDGKVTASAGSFVIAASFILSRTERLRFIVASTFLGAGLLVLGIALYDLLRDFGYPGSGLPTYSVDSSPTAWLIMLAAASALPIATGLQLLLQREAPLEDIVTNPLAERTEGWA